MVLLKEDTLENVPDFFDLIEKLEEDDIPGLLLLLDFEKAFDTLEWPFINETLKFFGFGPSYFRRIETLYSGSKSCIINNGHCSEYFHVSRGVRQGDPLSPYLFILSLELMSAALKNDPNINGVKINNSEFLLSQYADDSTLILDDDENSLKNSLFILEKFSECAGLRANLDNKTEAIWIGSKITSKNKLVPERNLNWNQTGKFKLLGIKFDLFSVDKTLCNYEEKILKIKSLLNAWIYRDLTYTGKITVIKSLALPILIQTLTVLPNPSLEIILNMQKIFFNFLWSGKPDKIKRNVIIGPYEEGGLKMPHLQSFIYSLKMTWINKLLDPMNVSQWKSLILDKYNKFGGEKIWQMQSEGIVEISKYFNTFWRDILLNWNILNEDTTDTIEGILKQSIWFNKNLKIDKEIVFYEKWCKRGIFFISDLLKEDNSFLTHQELCTKYNLNVNFIQYHSILHMIPKQWKIKIQNMGTNFRLMNSDILDYVKNHKKSCQFFYKKHLSLHSEQPKHQQERWNIELDSMIENWNFIYQLPFSNSKNNKYIMFQYKIIHRILSTNALLYKYKLKETHLCSFCNEIKETISHLFWGCIVVRNFWLEISKILREQCDIEIPNTAVEIVLGSETLSNFENFIVILIKYYIYSCRLKASVPSTPGIINMLKHTYEIEILSASFYRQPAMRDKIEQKWYALKNIFTY